MISFPFLLRSVHTRRQVAAARWGDTSQQQIASCVILENFCENLCRCNWILLPQQVAQFQSDLIFVTCCSDKIPLQRQRFSQKFSSTHEAICCSDVSPHHVAATCRLVCTDLYWLIDKFENMNTWSVDFWLTASEAICCISGSRHKVLNWNATILFSLICCKMALFSSSSFVNSSIPAGGFLREFAKDFWL